MSKETCDYLSGSDRERFEFEQNDDMETRKGTTIEHMTTFFVTRKAERDSK